MKQQTCVWVYMACLVFVAGGILYSVRDVWMMAEVQSRDSASDVAHVRERGIT